jgi:hypothetical protein
MLTRHKERGIRILSTGIGCAGIVAVLGFAFVTFLAPTHALASSTASGNFCTQTANLVFRACGHSVQDDYLIASAVCVNTSESAERTQCFSDASASRSEGNQLCQQQLAGRLDACKLLGEGRYDPEFDAKNFDADFTNLPNPNRYFPLRIGNLWEFRSANEVDTVEILNATKLIDGVRCVVARDLVVRNGFLAEATDDWYAQAKDGNTWYCGEEVKDFETFQGDKPKQPELVSIDGSFKAGRDGAKPGVIFLASPKAGDVYVEESSLNNAEDVTEILSTTYSFGKNAELDSFVPAKLAKFLCSGDCVVTKNYSLLEPGIFARKYYAPGIGVFLEVEPEGPNVIQLVKCNFDSRCALLPAR